MKKKFILLKLSVVLMLIIWLALLSPVYGQFKMAENLKFLIEPLKREYKASDRLILKYTFSNNSDKPINVLKWNTPLEGINADIFNVLFNNERALYLGRTIKRGKPKPGDYATIKPKEIISGEINFGDSYYISKTGDYSIELNTVILDFGYDAPAQLSAKQVFDSRSISSNKATFRLTEDKKIPEPVKISFKEDFSPKTPDFVGCSENQKAILKKALINADSSSKSAWLSLENAPMSDRATPKIERYINWFGIYNATNYNTVAGHFDKIYKALMMQTVTFHCDCNEDYYAYVYPTQPYNIYLCNLFWSAPDFGTDSKYGTIIHETSHFTVVAQTQDHVYGQAGAKNIALTDPAKAIYNADNHEYYAENNPPLQMPVPALPQAGLNLTIFSLILGGLIGVIIMVIRPKMVRAR